MTSDDKNTPDDKSSGQFSWTAKPEHESDTEIVSEAQIEKEATDAAMATVELFQNFDLDEPPREPDPRFEADAVPAQLDDLADDENIGVVRRVGSGFSRGLFWAVGLAFGLMIVTAIGLVWMIFNILAKFA